MVKIREIVKEKVIICYHCGDICENFGITIDDKVFCCNGCKSVFEILDDRNLCNYYDIIENPGISRKFKESNDLKRFEFLDDISVQNSLIEFKKDNKSFTTFNIPSIHCSSCIWLLENLYKLNHSILRSEVNFLQKKVRISFNDYEITLRQISELLFSIGYEPYFDNENIKAGNKSKVSKSVYYKLGIAGFCTGNIMLFSFPEYMGIDGSLSAEFFNYLNLLLSIPVFFYCSSDYFRSAFIGLKQKLINIDVPISLGLIVLFTRSVYEIITGTGAGFMDSLSGLVFLLLIGKVFQTKTYEVLNFDRNYRSYFPVSVTILNKGIEETKLISKIKTGDRLLIRNSELIPADGILFSGQANIDYSFVTGESVPVDKVSGEIVYAGGRQRGSAIEIEVIRKVSQSYLTQLWNSDTFKKEKEHGFVSAVNIIAKYFTVLILLISAAAAFYWFPMGVKYAINAFTAVLIIACPCGLALTNPFALGNALRILSTNKFYLKNSSVLEKLSNINTIIFDKTGTITYSGIGSIEFKGRNLTDSDVAMVRTLVRNSFHPLSRIIYESFDCKVSENVSGFEEIPGSGIKSFVDGHFLKLGSYSFVTDFKNSLDSNGMSTRVHLSVDGQYYGYFIFVNKVREGTENIFSYFKNKFNLILLSGDNENQKFELSKYFDFMHFRQTPEDKQNYVKELQAFSHNILMVGDGLNDAGALKQSDVGVVISDDVTGFSPASDGILDSNSFHKLYDFLKYAVAVKKFIYISFIISALYNIVGIGFAFTGQVSPLLAAILMPVSSVSVILFTVLSTSLYAKFIGLKT